ncbi:MAG: hypothetical protein F4Y24_09610 [Gemmatimonadetes bacterium]|nr:hypothetical protein [Gemmatimonadota bacterium]MYG23692.1 hypothetical protein [Gemmatimonadota bacterium]MYJ39509.1 hypothetical protein [Gemmatimonadota bacterium]
MNGHEKEAKSSEASLALTKALVLESAMMLIPGAAQAVGVVRSIYAHRFTSFVNRLAARLENVEADAERLASVIAETQALVLGSPVEEQDRILNAVFHAATTRCWPLSLQRRFIGMLSYFGNLHFQILNIMRTNEDPHGGLMDSLAGRIERHLGGLDPEELQLAWGDLYRESLVDAELVNSLGTSGGMCGKRTTALGDQFLAFVGNGTRSSQIDTP